VPTTFIIEPDPAGHRFQYAAHIAAVAARSTRVVLLTSVGGSTREEYATHLGHLGVDAREAFGSKTPAPSEVVAALQQSGAGRGDVVVVPEADKMITSWWRALPRGYPRRNSRPHVVLLMLQVPSHISWRDRRGWARSGAKVALAVVTRVRGAADTVASLVAQGDPSRGLLLRHVRDPAICSHRARDQEELRRRLGLPAGTPLVSVLGVVSARKNVPLVADAVFRLGGRATLVLAGWLLPEIEDWLAGLDDQRRDRVIVRRGHLPDEELDAYVAASDVVAVAHSNNGPSGLMGKALAAGTPALTAGSRVRARDAARWETVLHTDLDVDALAAALDRLVRHPPSLGNRSRADLPTGEQFASALLAGAPSGRTAPQPTPGARAGSH